MGTLPLSNLVAITTVTKKYQLSWRTARLLLSLIQFVRRPDFWHGDHGELTVSEFSILNEFLDFAANELQVEIVMPDLPVGTIIAFAGTVPQLGYLECCGQAVSREDYAFLFSVIGTVYGAGDGITTFNVPDLRARTVVGENDSPNFNSEYEQREIAQWGGVETYSLLEIHLPPHKHEIYELAKYRINASGSGGGLGWSSGGTAGNYYTGSVGAGYPHPNMPPFLVTKYLIKYM